MQQHPGPHEGWGKAVETGCWTSGGAWACWCGGCLADADAQQHPHPHEGWGKAVETGCWTSGGAWACWCGVDSGFALWISGELVAVMRVQMQSVHFVREHSIV